MRETPQSSKKASQRRVMFQRLKKENFKKQRESAVSSGANHGIGHGERNKK